MFGKKTVVSVLVVIAGYLISVQFAPKAPKTRSAVIETNAGKIQGIESTSRLGRKYYEFLGIPYARPPVGELRLEPPVEITKWNGIKDATKYGNECAQLVRYTSTVTVTGDEDCLFLNIFVPEPDQEDRTIASYYAVDTCCGGAFLSGNSDDYRPEYFMDENVILVTLNYRLGALGFMNTGDGIVRGNMGLKDQNMAMKWVNQNIKFFGGDPKLVTIFGESAGAASTSLHVLSPLSKGLFSKAIFQSGESTTNWAIHRNPAEQADDYAKDAGCFRKTRKDMVDCLKKLSTEDFVKAYKEVRTPLEPNHLFVPTIETTIDQNTFISKEPLEILKSGEANVVPLIAGVNSHEGLLSSAIIGANQSRLEEANRDFYNWAHKYLNIAPQEKEKLDKIRQFYFNNEANIASTDLIQNYTNLFSDWHFFIPLHEFVQMYYTRDVPIYLYYMRYQGKFSIAPLLKATQKPYLPVKINIILEMATRWVKTNVFGFEIEHMGVCHGDEIPYFFKWPMAPEISPSSKDFKISRELVSVWAAFASDRKSLNFFGTEWTPAVPPALKYLQIDSGAGMVDEPFAPRFKFWESLKSL